MKLYFSLARSCHPARPTSIGSRPWRHQRRGRSAEQSEWFGAGEWLPEDPGEDMAMGCHGTDNIGEPGPSDHGQDRNGT